MLKSPDKKTSKLIIAVLIMFRKLSREILQKTTIELTEMKAIVSAMKSEGMGLVAHQILQKKGLMSWSIQQWKLFKMKWLDAKTHIVPVS